MTFPEMKAAIVWGLTPRQWYVEPRWSRAKMLATVEMKDTVEFWVGEDMPKPKDK